MRIAVAGGTGVVGAHVVRIAADSGHEVRVLSRSRGVDLVTGAGLDLTGVDVVIDVSGSASLREAMSYFEASTHTLLRAERDAGVKHHVALSIARAVEHPHGYYAAKALQEQLIADGPIPWTILRTTQFFEFAEQKAVAVWRWAIVAKFLSRPVAAASVARRLVEIAEGEPRGMTPEFAGPDELRMADLARMVFETHGDQRGVIELPIPGKMGRSMRDGALLPGPDAEIDSTSYEEWLADGAH